MDDGSEHAAEKELGVAPGPSFVADLVQLPADRDELGKIPVVVRIVDGEKTRRLGRKGDGILPKHGGPWRRGLFG